MAPRILFILHLPPPVHGAAMVGQYIRDSRLINGTFDCHYINLTTATSLQDIGKSGAGKLWRFVKLLREIRRTVKRLRPQLVYVTPNAKGVAFYKDYVVVQMLKRCGCRVVCHYHNKGVRTRQDRWMDDLLYRRFFRGIKVILLAEVLYEDVRKYVRREDVYICPNGIPETVVGEPARPEHEVPHLLFLSNLLVEKGVLVLLDALRILKDRGYSFVCNFVGGETAEIDAARFEAEVRNRGLNELTIYRGRKFGAEKEKELEDADVFVLPTRNDCFPLVLLEAMEHALAIVSAREGGVPEMVKDGRNGIVYERTDESRLANALAVLLDDRSLREQMGTEGRRLFKERFTLAQFERNFADVLMKLNGGGGGVKLHLIRYHGSRHGEEKEDFLREADVLVFPTYYHNECFPLVLLEAMQHGVACISTEEGGIPGIVGDGTTGYLVRRQEAVGLAESLARLMDDGPLRSAMGKAGREKYRREFALPKFEEQMTDILGGLVG